MFALSLYFLGRNLLTLGHKLVMLNTQIGTDTLLNRRSLGGALIGAIVGIILTIIYAPDLLHTVSSPLDGATIICAVVGYTLGLLPSRQELETAN